MVWARGLGAVNVAATRSAAGTWSAAVQLSPNEAGNLSVAVDGAEMPSPPSSSTCRTPPLSRCTPRSFRPAPWGPPVLLSAPGDSVSNFFGGLVIADSAGTFVIAWTDGTTRTLNALTSPPGGGFGPAVTLAPNVGQIKRPPRSPRVMPC